MTLHQLASYRRTTYESIIHNTLDTQSIESQWYGIKSWWAKVTILYLFSLNIPRWNICRVVTVQSTLVLCDQAPVAHAPRPHSPPPAIQTIQSPPPSIKTPIRPFFWPNIFGDFKFICRFFPFKSNTAYPIFVNSRLRQQFVWCPLYGIVGVVDVVWGIFLLKLCVKSKLNLCLTCLNLFLLVLFIWRTNKKVQL